MYLKNQSTSIDVFSLVLWEMTLRGYERWYFFWRRVIRQYEVKLMRSYESS